MADVAQVEDLISAGIRGPTVRQQSGDLGLGGHDETTENP